MHPASDTHRVVAIDMGYGHLRPAHALADALGSEVLHADRPPLASTRDQQQWDYVRRYYEAISRASRWPLLGAPMRGLLDSITDIRDLYGERDQSSPNAGVQISASSTSHSSRRPGTQVARSISITGIGFLLDTGN